MSDVWALIPAKPFAQAKTRLAAVLPIDARASLAKCTLQHVLGTVMSVRHALGGIAVVTRAAEVAAVARAAGVVALSEGQTPTLNAALMHAQQLLAAKGAGALLVLPADLALLTGQDVMALLAKDPSTAPAVVLAPDAHEQGTNALLLRPLGLMPFVFGEESYARHKAIAQQAGVPLHVVHTPGLQFDLDTPDDLTKLFTEASLRRCG